MIAIKINNIKDFMTYLLRENMFDNFYVNEITIKSYNTFSINGRLNNVDKNLDCSFSKWSDLKNICNLIISGHETPSKFHITFLLSPKQIASFVLNNNINMDSTTINSLAINIKYENSSLICVTGTSIKLFSLDKSLENAWDKYILDFLKKKFTIENI